MFSFIHTYTDYSYDGLIKNGLLRTGDGLKIMHKPSFAGKAAEFNRICAENGKLFSRLSECKGPFYVDRLQGGICLPFAYEYDKNIVEKYKETFGNNFLGFQFHEWASNYLYETNRIIDTFEKWKNVQPSGAGLDDFFRAVQDNFRIKYKTGKEYETEILLYEES